MRLSHWGWGVVIGCLLLVGYLLSQTRNSLAHGSPTVHLPLLGARPALARLASGHGIRMGVAVHPTHFLTDPAYGHQVRAEFNSLTPEVVMKAQWIHPCPPEWLRTAYPAVETWATTHSGASQTADPGFVVDCRADPDEWNWRPMDEVVAWAKLNGLGVYGHALIWHSQNPGWLTHASLYDPITDEYLISQADMQAVMRDHITTIVARYCDPTLTIKYQGQEVALAGVVYAYDVVNEAVALDTQEQAVLQQGTIHEDSPFRPSRNPWLNAGAGTLTGESYVRRAFQYAQQARATHCPPNSVRLFYNDFDIETGGTKTDGVFRLLDSLDGVVDQQRTPTSPVEGIGFQAHLRLYPETAAPLPHDLTRLQPTFQHFATALDLEIKITEADVSLRRVRGIACGYSPGDPAAQDCSLPAPATYFAHPTPARSQAHVFAALARACREVATCTGFTVWGLSDVHSWLTCFHPQLFGRGTPLPCPTVAPTRTPATPTPQACGCQGTYCPPEESLHCHQAVPLGPTTTRPPFTPKPAYDALYQVWATPPATPPPFAGYPAPIPLTPPTHYP